MKKIWYLLKCPEGREAVYKEKCSESISSDKLQETICFQVRRMFRYRGMWHLETRLLLPGYIFLLGKQEIDLMQGIVGSEEQEQEISVFPCDAPFLKTLCQRDNLIEISKGIIRNGETIVTSGPLKGREELIRRIDRHKRTAEIEIPFGKDIKQVTVGLEIYEKQKADISRNR